jgi:hypothetical protein
MTGPAKPSRRRIRVTRTRTTTRHDPPRRLSVAVALLAIALVITWLLIGLGCVTHAHVVAGPTETVTDTETAGQPAEPAPPSTEIKKVKVYVTRTAPPRPSPAPGIAPGGHPVTVHVTWRPTIHIGRHVLDLVCKARKVGSHVVIPAAGNDTGTHIHCTGMRQSIRGFNMTVVCNWLTRNLPGHWIDLGNENDPSRWECQRE